MSRNFRQIASSGWDKQAEVQPLKEVDAVLPKTYSSWSLPVLSPNGLAWTLNQQIYYMGVLLNLWQLLHWQEKTMSRAVFAGASVAAQSG